MDKSTVVVLGNGFDIDLGLQTSFRDYLGSYLFYETPNAHSILVMRRLNMKDNTWSDIEGFFRHKLIEYVNNPSKNLCDDIQDTWLIISRSWSKYITEFTMLNKIKINHDSCAYELLTTTKDAHNWFTFNYTSPFYLSGINDKGEPKHVHGSFVPREQMPKGCMYLIPQNLIIGVDSYVSKTLIKDDNLKHIIKKQNPNFKPTTIINSMEKANNLIIFGHSLGITDSDYFNSFFKKIIKGIIVRKKIYIVTKDCSTLDAIKKAMKEYGVDYDKLLLSKSKIIPIFTDYGKDEKEFIKMIEILK